MLHWLQIPQHLDTDKSRPDRPLPWQNFSDKLPPPPPPSIFIASVILMESHSPGTQPTGPHLVTCDSQQQRPQPWQQSSQGQLNQVRVADRCRKKTWSSRVCLSKQQKTESDTATNWPLGGRKMCGCRRQKKIWTTLICCILLAFRVSCYSKWKQECSSHADHHIGSQQFSNYEI